MADRPKPIVRLLVVAERVGNELPNNDLVVRNPRALVLPDAGNAFPLREPRIALYVQLSGGLGRWELAVEFRQRLDSRLFRSIGTSPVLTTAFGPNARLGVWEVDFRFSNLPFRSEGLYEFRVLGRPADGPDGTTFEALEGLHPGVPTVAELRALAPGGRP